LHLLCLQAGVRKLTEHCPYFGREVEIFTALTDNAGTTAGWCMLLVR